MKQLFRKKFTWLFTLAIAALVVVPFMAFADDISNNLDLSVDADYETLALTAGGSAGYATLRVIEQNGDGKSGCNLTGSTILRIAVSSSDSAKATASLVQATSDTTKDTFTSCGDTIRVKVIPLAAGATDIIVSQLANTTAGSFNLAPAKFKVTVSTSNTAPTVSVTGVAHGATYEIGSVPTPGCSVVDAEDTNESATPVVSGISGPNASDGIGTQTVTCSYTDGDGITETDEATYEIVDTGAPIITFVSRTPANGNGWNNGSVTINWSCSDSGSGVVNAAVSQTVSAEGQNQSATGTCEDHAGNTASNMQIGINIDLTAPTLSFGAASPVANSNGWNNSDVSFSFTTGDNLSGVDTTSPVSPLVLSDEGSGVTDDVTVTDKAGNSAIFTSPAVNIDKTAPTASASASPAANANGWNKTNVTVSFSGNDGTGSDIDFCAPDVVLNTEGMGQSTSGTCTDKAGNISASAVKNGINIDKTDPTITFASRTAANSYGWNNTNVTVNWNCTDSLSGPNHTSVSQTVSTEGANQSAQGICEDLADNTASDTQTGINIDKTAPVLNISGAIGGSYGICSKPSRPTFSPSDSLSELDGSEGDSWTAPAGVGTYTYTAHAADKAGNNTTQTRTYTVNYSNASFSGFLQPINTTGLSSRFKLGSTIPVKFQLMCGTTPISNAVAKLYVKQGDSQPDPGVDEAISTAASTTGNLFRWTGSPDNQYIFNLSMKTGYIDPITNTVTSFAQGSWTLKIGLDDGTFKSVNIQIVK